MESSDDSISKIHKKDEDSSIDIEECKKSEFASILDSIESVEIIT